MLRDCMRLLDTSQDLVLVSFHLVNSLLKGTVHLKKISILSLFTPPHVVPNVYVILIMNDSE